MKNYVDFIPETPQGFHLRVEETLSSLEENDMKNFKVYSRRMIVAIAAILILALAATAFAVAQGNVLRTQMNESGGETLATRVQDVHVSDAADGFSFTIEEILWKGDDLYVSYTAAVPEDGNVYLFSPCQIELGGEQANNAYGIDEEFFTGMFALGGEYGTSVSQIMKLKVSEDLSGEQLFSSSCLFMRTERPLEKVEIEEIAALCTEPDADGNEKQLMKNADILYYFDTTEKGDPTPFVYLHYYPEIRAVMDENDRVTAETLESTGIARVADAREISVPIRKTEGEGIRFNDVAQRIFDMDGYSIEITKLEISQFKTEFEALIRKDGSEISEWTEEEPYGWFYSLYKADGSDLGIHHWAIGEGEVIAAESGEKAYRIGESTEGIYDLENLSEICLAPGIYDENGVLIRHDMSRAIKLTPIYNPDLPESAQIIDAVEIAENDDLSS